jgi:hypothetical protein
MVNESDRIARFQGATKVNEKEKNDGAIYVGSSSGLYSEQPQESTGTVLHCFRAVVGTIGVN